MTMVVLLQSKVMGQRVNRAEREIFKNSRRIRVIALSEKAMRGVKNPEILLPTLCRIVVSN